MNSTGEEERDDDEAKQCSCRMAMRLVTDGPFAESKEQLGGFYLLECKDLDEAMSWASKMPNIHRGSVEVRPIMEFEQA